MKGLLADIAHPIPSILGLFLGLLFVLGCTNIGRLILKRETKVEVNLGLGLILSSTFFLILSFLNLVNHYSVSFFWLVLLGITLSERDYLSSLFEELKESFKGLGKVEKITFVLFFILLIMNMMAPIRDDDSMRYHVAQVSEILRHKGFSFRPYVHFNFPMSFNLLFIPLVWMIDISVKVFVSLYGLIFALGFFGRWKGEKTSSLYLTMIFLLSPIGILQLTTVHNDFGVLFYFYNSLYLLKSYEDKGKASHLLLAGIFFGFSVSIKYMALFFGPWFGLLFVDTFLKRKDSKLFLLTIVLSVLIACPFYVKNLINLGNPFWPGLTDVFPGKNSYWDLVASQFSLSQTGVKGLSSMAKGFVNLFKFPFIPFVFWLPVFFFTFKKGNFLKWKIGFYSFLIFWGILQPRYYPRFLFYVFPIMVICSYDLLEYLKPRFEKIRKVTIYFYFLIFLSVFTFYSLDPVKFVFAGDLKKYHKATWFYDDFKVMNKTLGFNSKVFFVVRSDPSYYLEIPHERANPALDGTYDWKKRRSLPELLKYLKDFGFTHVFFTPFLEKNNAGEEVAIRVLNELKNSENVKVIFDKNVEIYTGRVLGKKGSVEAILLELI